MAMVLWDHLPEITARLAGAQHLLVLLDYDGTLTPIVDKPEDAILDRHICQTIALLSRRPKTTVAILSGRALDDVRTRVGIKGLIYAGNHGFEIQGPGMSFACPEAEALKRELQELAEALTHHFCRIPGVRVEDKRLTLSIHYRLVPENKLPEFRDALAKAVGILSSCFQVTTGKKVHEIRPKTAWDKGTASLWICNHLGVPDTLLIYLGDDRTDEDAFAALKEGITVKVGQRKGTVANYSLADPVEVDRFLNWLVASGKG